MNSPAGGEYKHAIREFPIHGEPGPLQRLIGDQRVLFLVVGAANTVFSTTLFALFVIFFGALAPTAVYVLLAWFLALVVFFFVYRRLVFKVSGHAWVDFARFTSVNTMGLLLTMAAVTLFVDMLGFPAIPVQIAVTVSITVFNYLGHKYFSFRR